MCSDCRSTQSQHSGSVSRPDSPGLLDILRQVPTLPELLSTDSQKALLSACSSLRKTFVAQIRVVTINCLDDIPLLVKRRCSWPRLSIVVLWQAEFGPCRNDSCVSPPAQARDRSKQLLLTVLVSENKSSRNLVCLLKPLHAPAAVSACLPLAAQQLAHQLTIKWPCMQTFMLSGREKLDGLGMEIVAQLVQGSWTSLVNLHLMGSDLRAQAFLLLSQGNWPHLKDFGCVPEFPRC